jgi:hypothetical protein
VTESELQAEVCRLCRKYEVLYFHSTDSRWDIGPGFPDLVLVKSSVLWVELKSSTGTLKPEQRIWRYALEDARQQYRLWRPGDLTNETIEETLSTL